MAKPKDTKRPAPRTTNTHDKPRTEQRAKAAASKRDAFDRHSKRRFK